MFVFLLEKLQHVGRPDFMAAQGAHLRHADAIQVQGVAEPAKEIVIGHGLCPFNCFEGHLTLLRDRAL
jgi:hypothetical protein